jgi:hypothetical protein
LRCRRRAIGHEAERAAKNDVARRSEKMQACEKQAADQHIKMDERSKFVMDCMTATK